MSIGLHRQQHQAGKSTPSQSRDQAAGEAKEQGMGPTLKGTFVSVMILGGFIVATWAAVFILFLVRQ